MNARVPNPYFKFVERAPYEIGHLLRQMSAHFSAYEPVAPDDRLIAEALTQHATNANDTLMSGIEAIGHVLQTAFHNPAWEMSPQQLKGIAGLLVHLSAEAQFMQELDWEIKCALDADALRRADTGQESKAPASAASPDESGQSSCVKKHTSAVG
ncbi:hypothetical protein F2P45_06290 [Massilia sp. CCM 8733]|uniref:Uncharacterized protein n=1 Tax=Massilia mucilaginosa TaxID=2609282 RepID=A0ABX0NPE4_9BURK|nr:hypothetical protein [Massilia mucilaginosa]NHZ88633.1 hypothetical protein [Massilia mucilaginosa]